MTIGGAHEVLLDASSKNDMTTAATGGSAGKTAVTPVVAISVANNDSHATLGALTDDSTGDAQAMTIKGSLKASAAHAGSVHTSAEGNTKSADTGVGISIALTIASDTALATTARDLTAAGAVTFSARSTGSDDALAKASSAGGEQTPAAAKDGKDQGGGISNQIHNQRDFADKRGAAAGAKAGTTASTDGKTAAEGEGGSVQVAGAVGVTVALSTSQASIPDGRTIIAGNGTGVTDGSLTLRAQNNTDASASADASAVVINTLAFNPAAGKDVDASADTITLHTGHGLATGDKVAFRGAEGVGLTDKTSYFAHVDGNKVSLYDTLDHAKAGGTDTIASVELIRNSAIIYTVPNAGKKDVDFEYTDRSPQPGTNWYYVRVIQMDRNLAWSSPVWVTYQ